MKKKPLIVLTGPTAAGKTKLSIRLAKKIGGEIISADSMQVYKGMDIGSAKIKTEEMEGICHHLVDVLEPYEEFHVVRFQKMAKEALEKIYAKGHIPIVVGGTGFYIQALLYDIDFTENKGDDSCRQELLAFAREHGEEALHEKLRQVDPVSAREIHFRNNLIYSLVKIFYANLSLDFNIIYVILNFIKYNMKGELNWRLTRYHRGYSL